jgi:bifunctional ADP-heptose synthase (sugar kinase/adenylyltransferase)
LAWSDGKQVRRLPAVLVEVCDACEAGDTVLATLGEVMPGGGGLEEGCRRVVRAAAE